MLWQTIQGSITETLTTHRSPCLIFQCLSLQLYLYSLRVRPFVFNRLFPRGAGKILIDALGVGRFSNGHTFGKCQAESGVSLGLAALSLSQGGLPQDPLGGGRAPWEDWRRAPWRWAVPLPAQHRWGAPQAAPRTAFCRLFRWEWSFMLLNLLFPS